MKTTHTTAAGLAMLAALGLTLAGCGESGDGHAHGPDSHDHAPSQPAAGGGDTHVHADGSTHGAHRPEPKATTPAASDGGHTHADGSTHAAHEPKPAAPAPAESSSTHTHADGSTHGSHGDDSPSASGSGGKLVLQADEVALDSATVGGMSVQFAQGHGAVAAGKEGHLVVKLPYNDNGATLVRAWIGTQDRTLSYVGRGGYSTSRGVYDIHAMAPSPLPANTMWWIEIEKPDGSKVVGSAKPIME